MPQKIFFLKREKGGLSFKDNKNNIFLLPSDCLSYTPKEGEIFYLKISKKEDQAKEMLNKLLDIK